MLNIDGYSVEAGPGESLLNLISRLPIPAEKLSERPLAAKIAGEVFTLNYVPLRQKDAQGERPSMRQAMAASEGKVHLLRYTDEAGKECYLRTALFAVFLALKQCCPRARGKVSCTLGSSVYVQVSGAKNFSAEELKETLQKLADQNIPLIRRRVPLHQAMERFRAEGQEDKARLLRWRSANYFDEYVYKGYADYFYGEMLPSTGYLTVWDIVPAENGFILVYPDDQNPDFCAKIPDMPNFFSVFAEGV